MFHSREGGAIIYIYIKKIRFNCLCPHIPLQQWSKLRLADYGFFLGLHLFCLADVMGCYVLIVIGPMIYGGFMPRPPTQIQDAILLSELGKDP